MSYVIHLSEYACLRVAEIITVRSEFNSGVSPYAEQVSAVITFVLYSNSPWRKLLPFMLYCITKETIKTAYNKDQLCLYYCCCKGYHFCTELICFDIYKLWWMFQKPGPWRNLTVITCIVNCVIVCCFMIVAQFSKA